MELNEKTVLDNNMLLKNVLVEITNKYNVFMNHFVQIQKKKKLLLHANTQQSSCSPKTGVSPVQFIDTALIVDAITFAKNIPFIRKNIRRIV